ncbi:hypothetical protein [Paenibacillus sp. V4I3]|uniref:hypothetical protein n=1 Tax=Paenibacillus sp. V4I3 TaxID=3042305 RepID=UPI0027D8FEF5|nr:hypothetical protein [Paenibacillus sp. V4I3]
MKFKQSDGQNQRIERISTTHLIVGIDIAKETHVAQATNFRGIILTKRHLSFSNTIEGYMKLERWIHEIGQKQGENRNKFLSFIGTTFCHPTTEEVIS